MRTLKTVCLVMLLVLAAATVRAEWELRVSASSFLDGNNGTSYPPANLIDGDASRPWIEGVKGEGVGEWIEIGFPENATVTRLGLRNGCQYEDRSFIRNNRIRQARLVFSDRSEQVVELRDTPELQYIYVRATPTASLRLVIDSVHWAYLLRNREHTCLSELSIDVEGKGEVTPVLRQRGKDTMVVAQAAAAPAPAPVPSPPPAAPAPEAPAPAPAQPEPPAPAPVVVQAVPAAAAAEPAPAPAVAAAPVPAPVPAAPPVPPAPAVPAEPAVAAAPAAVPDPAPAAAAVPQPAPAEPAPAPSAAPPVQAAGPATPPPAAEPQPAPVKKGVLSAAKGVPEQEARDVAALIRSFYTRLCTLEDSFVELFARVVRDKEALAFEVFAQKQRQRGLYEKFRKARVSLDGLDITVLSVEPDRARVRVSGTYTVFLPETYRDFPEDVVFTLSREAGEWKVLERDDQAGR